jgi:hypothetical protein
MKVRAPRPSDVDDIELLVARLDLHSIDQVVRVHDDVFPDDPLPEHKRLLVEDVIAAAERRAS